MPVLRPTPLNTLSEVAAARGLAVTKGSILAGAYHELSVALIKCQGSVYRGCANLMAVVTKRRSSRACIGNPKPEQETIKGTHAQETPTYQRRPTTLHAAQGSNPPIRAPYMQLAKIPHRLPPVPQAQTSTAPTAGATGTIPAHTQLKRGAGATPWRPKTRLDTEARAPGQLPGARGLARPEHRV